MKLYATPSWFKPAVNLNFTPDKSLCRILSDDAVLEHVVQRREVFVGIEMSLPTQIVSKASCPFWQQNSDEKGDDRDHNQEFDQCESAVFRDATLLRKEIV